MELERIIALIVLIVLIIFITRMFILASKPTTALIKKWKQFAESNNLNFEKGEKHIADPIIFGDFRGYFLSIKRIAGNERIDSH